MVKVVFSGKVRYRQISYDPYQPFLVDDADKDEMVRYGATIVEEKAVNPHKVAAVDNVESVAEKNSVADSAEDKVDKKGKKKD